MRKGKQRSNIYFMNFSNDKLYLSLSQVLKYFQSDLRVTIWINFDKWNANISRKYYSTEIGLPEFNMFIYFFCKFLTYIFHSIRKAEASLRFFAACQKRNRRGDGSIADFSRKLYAAYHIVDNDAVEREV